MDINLKELRLLKFFINSENGRNVFHSFDSSWHLISELISKKITLIYTYILYQTEIIFNYFTENKKKM